jgi:hypothetical protein
VELGVYVGEIVVDFSDVWSFEMAPAPQPIVVLDVPYFALEQGGIVVVLNNVVYVYYSHYTAKCCLLIDL